MQTVSQFELVTSTSTGVELLRSYKGQTNCMHCGASCDTGWTYAVLQPTDVEPQLVGEYCTVLRARTRRAA